MADRRPLIINSSAQQIQEFTDSDNLVLSGQSLKFLSPLIEKVDIDSTALTGTYTHNLITDGNLHYATTAPTGNYTYNLTGSNTVDLDDMMSIGQSLSFALFVEGSTFYMANFQIDGSTQTVEWQGGANPQTRTGSGTDNYALTIIKTGNATFKVFGALSNHA
tara:strand:- start:901 stop:1389 length:489 start_codon:yes stop_codon:yes gene_type:complete